MASNKTKNVIVSAPTSKRLFAYERNGFKANFDCRTDIEGELQDAIAICQRFIVDATEQLKTFKKGKKDKK